MNTYDTLLRARLSMLPRGAAIPSTKISLEALSPPVRHELDQLIRALEVRLRTYGCTVDVRGDVLALLGLVDP